MVDLFFSYMKENNMTLYLKSVSYKSKICLYILFLSGANVGNPQILFNIEFQEDNCGRVSFKAIAIGIDRKSIASLKSDSNNVH